MRTVGRPRSGPHASQPWPALPLDPRLRATGVAAVMELQPYASLRYCGWIQASPPGLPASPTASISARRMLAAFSTASGSNAGRERREPAVGHFMLAIRVVCAPGGDVVPQLPQHAHLGRGTRRRMCRKWKDMDSNIRPAPAAAAAAAAAAAVAAAAAAAFPAAPATRAGGGTLLVSKRPSPGPGPPYKPQVLSVITDGDRDGVPLSTGAARNLHICPRYGQSSTMAIVMECHYQQGQVPALAFRVSEGARPNRTCAPRASDDGRGSRVGGPTAATLQLAPGSPPPKAALLHAQRQSALSFSGRC